MSNQIDLDFFETVILYNCLMAKDGTYLASTIQYLNPLYFRNEDIRSVIGVVSEFYDKYDKAPNVSEIQARLHTPELRSAFRGAVEKFKSLNSKYHPEELLANTETFFKQRMIAEILHDAEKDRANGKPVDVTQMFDRLDAAHGVTLLQDLGMDFFNDIDKHIEQMQQTVERISTGWKWLDDKLKGGWLKDGRGLYVFSGVTNVGKSIFLGNIACNALAQDKTTVIITLEMSEQVYATRMDALMTQIALNELDKDPDLLRQKLNQYKQQCKSRLFIKEFPPSTVSARHISAYLKQLKRQGINPEVLVLDYLSLLEPIKSYGSTYVDVKKIAEQVRALTYIYKCPCISATQLNRDAFNVDNPGLETTSESMGLSHTVDAQFSIWSSEIDAEAGVINLGIMKNRFGPKFGQTQLQLDYDTLTLRDLDNKQYTSGDITSLLGSVK